MAVAKHAKINLESPALTNALKLIESSGSGMDFSTVKKLNEQFKSDQSSLRVLQTAYKKNGVVSNAGIDGLIYEPDSTFENLRKQSFDAFVGDGGSLNHLSNAINKVAALEGVDFPVQIDPTGSIDAMRQAAGLPNSAEKAEAENE